MIVFDDETCFWETSGTEEISTLPTHQYHLFAQLTYVTIPMASIISMITSPPSLTYKNTLLQDPRVKFVRQDHPSNCQTMLDVLKTISDILSFGSRQVWDIKIK